LLGRHVRKRSGNAGHVGIAQGDVSYIIGFQEYCEAEIQNFYLIFRRDEDVAGLQITVDDAVLVGFFEGRGYL
jgi:hypothetical protein